MSQSAVNACSGKAEDSYDFNQNYRYLKKLIHALKIENEGSVRREIFGQEQRTRALTKKEMKQLFRYLRTIEHTYEECLTPPIPEELEHCIRNKDDSAWLPWEMEAIEKVDCWRAELEARRRTARASLERTLENFRRGERPS
jgi:hypothetical protein